MMMRGILAVVLFFSPLLLGCNGIEISSGVQVELRENARATFAMPRQWQHTLQTVTWYLQQHHSLPATCQDTCLSVFGICNEASFATITSTSQMPAIAASAGFTCQVTYSGLPSSNIDPIYDPEENACFVGGGGGLCGTFGNQNNALRFCPCIPQTPTESLSSSTPPSLTASATRSHSVSPTISTTSTRTATPTLSRSQAPSSSTSVSPASSFTQTPSGSQTPSSTSSTTRSKTSTRTPSSSQTASSTPAPSSGAGGEVPQNVIISGQSYTVSVATTVSGATFGVTNGGTLNILAPTVANSIVVSTGSLLNVDSSLSGTSAELDGTYQLHVSSPNPPAIHVSGHSNNFGPLVLVIDPNFTFGVGTTVTIITFGSSSGLFSSVSIVSQAGRSLRNVQTSTATVQCGASSCSVVGTGGTPGPECSDYACRVGVGVGVGVGGGLLVLAIILAILCCCCRRPTAKAAAPAPPTWSTTSSTTGTGSTASYYSDYSAYSGYDDGGDYDGGDYSGGGTGDYSSGAGDDSGYSGGGDDDYSGGYDGY